MKWLLFVVSLFSLWVSFNSLFMLPGQYSAFNFEIAAVGIAIGVLTAWLSSKRFADAQRKRRRSGAILEAPPIALCLFVLVVFCVMGVLKLTASR
jgi:hypothetical protein